MNKAEEIFRTYFASTEELHAFRSKYQVVSFTDGDQWGVGSCELHVCNPDGQHMVFDDKPSKIYVMPAATWYAIIAWEHPNGVLHRDGKPAVVSVDTNCSVQESYYRNGTETGSQGRQGHRKKTQKGFFRGVEICS